VTNFRSPNEIVESVVEWLQTAKWDRGDLGEETAFERVEAYVSTQLEEALRDLIVSESRIAIVVPSGSRWETMQRNDLLRPVCRRTTSVVVLVSDRIIGDEEAAYTGSDDNPGCADLAELAIEAVSGQLMGSSPAVYAVPVSDELLKATTDEETQPGRLCVSIEFDCFTDWDAVSPGT
jgi:hypothetical protein